MKNCEKCGSRLEKNICSNCEEELFIETFQGEYIDHPLSNEWQEKTKKQRIDVRKRVGVEVIDD